MSTLFVVDGAFGTSKRFLLGYLSSASHRHTSSVVQKYTSVKDDNEAFINPDISLDLNVISEEQFNEVVSTETCYHYSLFPQRYAIPKDHINEKLKRHPHVFVVVRDRGTIRSMKEELSEQDVRVVPVYIYVDEAHLREGLKSSKQDMGVEDLELHLKRYRSTWEEYIHDIGFYTHILINNKDNDDFYRQIDTLIKLYPGE